MQKQDLKPITRKNNRNSSIELLRIVAMLFVVLSHSCVHSGMDVDSMPISLNKFIVQWGTLGNLGVDIYVMITGYFLCTKESGHLKSLTKLFTQVWFYSISLFFVRCIYLGFDVSLHELLAVFIPTIFNQYWFFTAYVVLLVLSSGLNILANNAAREQLSRLLVGLFILWVIIPTITAKNMYGTQVAQFILFYLIGAYFRMYPENCFQKKAFRQVIIIVSFLLMFMSTVVLDVLGTKLSVFATHGTFFYGRNSLLIVSCAIGLLANAVYRKPFYNQFINTVGSCTFGVYLIHESISFRQILWEQLLPVAKFRGSPLLVFVLIGAVFVVFAGATLIEYLRQNTVAKPMTRALDACLAKVIHLTKRCFNHIYPKT